MSELGRQQVTPKHPICPTDLTSGHALSITEDEPMTTPCATTAAGEGREHVQTETRNGGARVVTDRPEPLRKPHWNVGSDMD